MRSGVTQVGRWGALVLIGACHPALTPMAMSAPPATPSTPTAPDAGARPAPRPTPPRDRPAAPAPAPTKPAVSLVAAPLAREFRGVWVASVANIDWPSRRTLTT